MANTVAKDVLLEGDRHAFTRFYAISDGATGDLTDEAVIEMSDLANDPDAVTVQRIWYSCVGCDAKMEWNGLPDRECWTLAEDSDQFDFRSVDGLYNVTDWQGNPGFNDGTIKMTTSGFATAGDAITLYMLLKKEFA